MLSKVEKLVIGHIHITRVIKNIKCAFTITARDYISTNPALINDIYQHHNIELVKL